MKRELTRLEEIVAEVLSLTSGELPPSSLRDPSVRTLGAALRAPKVPSWGQYVEWCEAESERATRSQRYEQSGIALGDTVRA
jgi:hypothetical protein